MVNLIKLGGGDPLCTLQEQNDCTAGLHARGICEIPYTKVNQVDTSYTGQTQGRASLDILTLRGQTLQGRAPLDILTLRGRTVQGRASPDILTLRGRTLQGRASLDILTLRGQTLQGRAPLDILTLRGLLFLPLIGHCSLFYT